MSDNNRVSLKLTLKETTRRIGYDLTQLNLENLDKIIRKFFSLSEDYQFNITYFDEDKDCITVTTNEELEEALHVHQGKTLHFHVASQSQSGHRRGHWYLHRQGMQMMEVKEYAKARELFRKQFSLTAHATPMYNIACCDALLGEASEAIAHLNQAVDLGYCNSEHTLNDEDLKSLRDNGEFQKVLQRMAEVNKDASVGFGGGCGRRWWRGFGGGGGCGRRGGWKNRCGRFGFSNCEVSKEGEAPKETQKVEKEVEQAKEIQVEPIVSTTGDKIEVSPVPSAPIPSTTTYVPQCIYPPTGYQPFIPVQEQVVPEKSELEKKLDLLSELGLVDRRRNLAALQRANGNIEQAVSALLW